MFKARGTLASWQPCALSVRKREGKQKESEDEHVRDLQVEILEGLFEAIEGPLCQGDVVVRELERVQPGWPA